jgi:hypothetical protein
VVTTTSESEGLRLRYREPGRGRRLTEPRSPRHGRRPEDERVPSGIGGDDDGEPDDAAAAWVDGLVNMLRFEVEDAARRAVMTTGESEQLLARLVLVIDQALSTPDPP